MPIDPTQLRFNTRSASSGATATATGGARGVDFRDLIDPRDTASDRHPQTRSDLALKSARQAVALNFVQPILAQAHKDPFQVAMFHGGQAETVFQQRMDQVLAARITQRTNMPIVDSIYRSLMKSEARRQARPAAAAGGMDLHG